MNRKKQLLLYSYIVILISSSLLYAQQTDEIPHFVATRIQARSLSRDKVIQMVGMTEQVHRANAEAWYATFAVTPEYISSRHSRNITECLFGPDLITNCDRRPGRTIFVQGSAVSQRNSHAWLADYFYLPRDYNSVISFKPHIRNVLVNFDFYLGLDSWIKNGYIRIYSPFVHTSWNLDLDEVIENSGELGYPMGYFAPTEIPRDKLLKNFAQYAAGCSIESIDNILFDPLGAGRMLTESEQKNGMSSIRVEFGNNLLNTSDYRIGLNIQAALSTGTKVPACNLFGPQLGNTFWELGAGFNAFYHLYRSEDEDMHFMISADGNLTHLFKKKEQRTFDLKGKPNSRYMLAERMTTSITGNLQNNAGTAPDAQFANQYAPVANLTVQDVRVNCRLQADLVLMCTFAWYGLNWDFGYQYWCRTGEHIHPDTDRPSLLNAQRWALKGDARTYGFVNDAMGDDNNMPIALSATQSNATINTGAEKQVNLELNNNSQANAPTAAFGGSGPSQLKVNITNATQINTSFQPVLLKPDDIEYRAGIHSSSNKLFSYVGYAFDCNCFTPYIGVGGFIEFGSNDDRQVLNNDEEKKCATTLQCSISQWAAFLKVGCSFN